MPENLEVRLAVMESQMADLKHGIALQAREYERRLEELNHAHERQVESNRHYVSREAWELKHSELEIRVLTIDRWRWMSLGAASSIGAILGALMVRWLR
jgi:uncharacterized protein YjbK